MIVKELITLLRYKNDEREKRDYDRGLKDTERKAEQSAGRMTNAVRGHHEASRRSMSGFTAHVKRNFSNIEKNASSTFSKIAKWAAGLAAGYVGFQAFKTLGTSIFNVGVEYERLNAALVTVTGSQKSADSVFKNLEKFAATTPYNLNKSVEAFIKLKALGLDPSNRALKSYGNTASAMGKDLMQMIEAVADASTGEFERLKEFGIKSSSHGDKVSFTFQGVTTTVGKNSKEIQDYLLRLGETKFAGGMERQSKTIGGLISTMQDNFSALGRKIWKEGLAEPSKNLVKWLTDLPVKMEPFLKQLIDAGTKYIPKFIASIVALKPLLPWLAGAIGLLTLRYVGLKAILAAQWIWNAYTAFRAMTGAAILAQIATFAIPIAIGAAVAAVVWLGYEIYKFMTTGEGMIKTFREKFPFLARIIENFFVKPVVWGIKVIIAIFKTLYKWVMDAVKWWIPKFTTAFSFWGDVVRDVKQNFVNFFSYLGKKFPWLEKIATKVGNAVQTAWEWMFGAGESGFKGTQGNIAKTAIEFVRTGAGAKFKTSDKVFNSFVTKELFKVGNACAQTTEEILRLSGASQAVLNAMTASAPGSYRNLVSRGLATPVSSPMPGDLVFRKDAKFGQSHVGIYTGDGKIVDARGRGSAQTPTYGNHWFSGQAQYLRIKPDQIMSGSQSATGRASAPVVSISNVVNVPPGTSNPGQIAARVGTATENSARKALDQIRRSHPRAVPQ